MGRDAAVVVGAGPNGLSAAITLARAGRDVTVLEARPKPGGAVSSDELTLPGFVHDTWSAVYPAAAASPAFAEYDLGRFGLEWVHPEACYAHPLDGGRAATLYGSRERTAASLDALHPGDGAAWLAFTEPLVRHIGALRDTLLSAFPPVKGPAELVARLGGRASVDLLRLLLMPAQGLGDELFGSGGSKAWLYSSAMHGDVPPHGTGSAIAAVYLNVLGHAVGWPSPKGGAGRLAEALVAALEHAGGRVVCDARVDRLEIARGQVTGAITASGERHPASLVVCDVLPHALLRMCDGALPARYAAALGRYRMGPATLKVDWALDGPIPWEAPEGRIAGTLHVCGEDDELLEATSAHAGLPERPLLLLGQQSVHDPTRAPAGKQVAWAYTHGPQGVDWAVEGPRHVERIEAQVERFAPGFQDRILARHVQLPADLERANANLVGGDVGAGSYAFDQLVFRPVPSVRPYRTPVRGLYLGSAATFPGGAVHGVPGRAAARTALLESRVRRF